MATLGADLPEVLLRELGEAEALRGIADAVRETPGSVGDVVDAHVALRPQVQVDIAHPKHGCGLVEQVEEPDPQLEPLRPANGQVLEEREVEVQRDGSRR
jgi:hypothetical protein